MQASAPLNGREVVRSRWLLASGQRTTRGPKQSLAQQSLNGGAVPFLLLKHLEGCLYNRHRSRRGHLPTDFLGHAPTGVNSRWDLPHLTPKLTPRQTGGSGLGRTPDPRETEDQPNHSILVTCKV